jgi:hypothetical protein
VSKIQEFIAKTKIICISTSFKKEIRIYVAKKITGSSIFVELLVAVRELLINWISDLTLGGKLGQFCQ